VNLLARLTPTENVEFKLVKKLTSEQAQATNSSDKRAERII